METRDAVDEAADAGDEVGACGIAVDNGDGGRGGIADTVVDTGDAGRGDTVGTGSTPLPPHG